MPSHQQIETVRNFSMDQLMLISYGAARYLGWKVIDAGADRILTHVPGRGGSITAEVGIEIKPSTVVVTSITDEGSFDLFKKNSKNVSRFFAAFDLMAAQANAANFQDWEKGLLQVQQRSMFDIEERDTADARWSLSFFPSTLAIASINILVFILMVLGGAGFFEVSVERLVAWGGNYRPLTVGGDWWRLVTSFFIHTGIVHLVFNMYALLVAGFYLEPVLGRLRFIAAFLCTGIFASVSSIWWNHEGIVSAGASGATFGLFGVLIPFLFFTKLFPAASKKGLVTSVLVFVGFNIIYGFSSPSIDNAAHVGGLIFGLLTGLFFLPGAGSSSFGNVLVRVFALLAIIVFISGVYLYHEKDDSANYRKKISRIMQLQEEALEPIRNPDYENMLTEVSTISQPRWQEARDIMNETRSYVLGSRLSQHRDLMLQYIELRNQHTDLMIIALIGSENVDGELEVLVSQIDSVVTKMETASPE